MFQLTSASDDVVSLVIRDNEGKMIACVAVAPLTGGRLTVSGYAMGGYRIHDESALTPLMGVFDGSVFRFRQHGSPLFRKTEGGYRLDIEGSPVHPIGDWTELVEVLD